MDQKSILVNHLENMTKLKFNQFELYRMQGWIPLDKVKIDFETDKLIPFPRSYYMRYIITWKRPPEIDLDK